MLLFIVPGLATNVGRGPGGPLQPRRGWSDEFAGSPAVYGSQEWPHAALGGQHHQQRQRSGFGAVADDAIFAVDRMDSKPSVFIRIPLYGAILYGLWVVLGTASRGALLGTFVAFAFVLWRATLRQRLIAVLDGFVLRVTLMAALPDLAANRLGSLFGEQNIEAHASADIRNRLFWQSLTYTFQHPLFGVGPGQFSNYMSQEHEVKQAMCHPTHCAWTQVSSECGVPGLLSFVLGLGSAGFGVARTYRTARALGNSDIANACFCYLLAMVGFLVSITFLSNAFTPVIPLMVGLGIAIRVSAARQMAAESGPRVLVGGFVGPLKEPRSG